MASYFLQEKKIKKIILPEDCPSCNSKKSIETSVSQNYFSFVIIPVFPLFKLTNSKCTHCKKEFKTEDLSPDSQAAIHKLRNEAKTPWWSYLGAIMLVFFIVLGAIAMSADKKKNKKLMANPQKGDWLEIKLGDDLFTFYRIDSVGADSAYLHSANQTATNLFLLGELKPKGDSLFTGTIFSLHKSKLLEMVEEGVIDGVDRK